MLKVWKTLFPILGEIVFRKINDILLNDGDFCDVLYGKYSKQNRLEWATKPFKIPYNGWIKKFCIKKPQ
jgi:hypothetical protein